MGGFVANIVGVYSNGRPSEDLTLDHELI